EWADNTTSAATVRRSGIERLFRTGATLESTEAGTPDPPNGGTLESTAAVRTSLRRAGECPKGRADCLRRCGHETDSVHPWGLGGRGRKGPSRYGSMTCAPA